MNPDLPPGRIKDIRVYRDSFIGMVLLFCSSFLILGSAGVYGVLVTVALSVLWVIFFLMGCRWFMPRPRRVVVVAVLSMLSWLVAVLLAR